MLQEPKDKTKNLENRDGQIKFLKELFCIAIGTIVGIATYVACLYAHLAIFGWNIGLAIAPIFAGYVESILAKKILHESTGAVSAFIMFIITVVYGFIISNPTLGFNVITAGSLVVIVQAAFPTAMNYFLIAMGLGIVSHISGVFKKIMDFVANSYEKIFKKESRIKKAQKEKENNYVHSFYDGELEMNKLGVLLLTLDYPPEGLKIKEQKGIYEARHIFSSDKKEEVRLGLEDTLEEKIINGVKLAQDKALLKLIKQLKADGCNGILDMNIIYDTVGPEKGENINQVIIDGTGVVFEEEGEL